MRTTTPMAPAPARPSYRDYLRCRFGRGDEGPLTDFLARRGGRLIFGERLDLNELAEQRGAPLEVVCCPLIERQIGRMLGWAAAARRQTGYAGELLYAYASKANQAAEAVGAALAAGAHYETSSAADVQIARRLWAAGALPGERYVLCNGSKDQAYLEAMLGLRAAGHPRVVPILDDPAELEALLAHDPPPLLLGVRERLSAGGDDGRFGMSLEEIAAVAARLAGTPHRLVLYHAMAGSQIEDAGWWAGRLERSFRAYCRLRRDAPSLHMFDIGGGMPTSAYRLDFAFDYQGLLERLMRALADVCAAHGQPHPDIVGEFGRYTVACHSAQLLRVGAVKPGRLGRPDWYLLDGSLMLALPDLLIVPGQQFIVLPLTGWDAPATPVRLAGRHTCNSDDVYPRPGQPPLVLPACGPGLVVAIFGVGAYQQGLSGRGGAHHCLAPEPPRLIVEERGGLPLVREAPAQSPEATMALLGYDDLLLAERAAPAARRALWRQEAGI